jgi:hypothetical protein
MTKSLNNFADLAATSATPEIFEPDVPERDVNTIWTWPDTDYHGEDDLDIDDVVDLDKLQIFAPHETGYYAAQANGFRIIRRFEAAIRDRDSLAGRYTVSIDQWTREEDYCDCSDQYQDAHIFAWDLAADAALGNALTIIDAQRRDDEVARMIRLQRVKSDNTYIPW